MSQRPPSPLDQVGTPVSKPSRDWLWVLGILAGAFLVLSLICCGVGYVVWYQASGALTGAMAEEYADHPVVVEHIGEINETGMDFETKSADDDDDSVELEFSIELSGDKGSGKIVFRTDEEDGGENVLVMDDGRVFPLDEPVKDESSLPEDVSAEFEEQDSDSGETSGPADEAAGQDASDAGAATP